MASISQRPRQRLSKSQRRRQTQQARRTRRRLSHLYDRLPPAARAVLDPLRPAFTRPTFVRVVVLILAAVLTVGRHTVRNLLRTLGALLPGHTSSYHRVFSQRRWGTWRLA